MPETTTTADTLCLRCGGGTLVSSHLEHPIGFCVTHDAHHGRLRLGLNALLCLDCGHVELVVPDTSKIIARPEAAEAGVIQEEDF